MRYRNYVCIGICMREKRGLWIWHLNTRGQTFQTWTMPLGPCAGGELERMHWTQLERNQIDTDVTMMSEKRIAFEDRGPGFGNALAIDQGDLTMIGQTQANEHPRCACAH